MNIFQGFIARMEELLYNADVDMDAHEFINRALLGCFAFGAVASLAALYLGSQVVTYAVALVSLIGLPLVIIAWLVTRANKRTAQIEEMFPNFLSMMASNIRSGVTYDRALLLSSRKEFGPLAKEIDRAAKQTIAGKPLPEALMEMAKRSRSETFAKTMRLIVEGVNAGGNLAEMLETTAIDIRQSSSLRKEVSATVLVYRLFIFMAAAVGAPLLYGLTGFLIDVFTGIRADAKMEGGTSAVAAQLPMFSQGEALSPALFFNYALVAIGMTALLSCLATGVISKGKESEGIPDIGATLLIAYGIFFGVRALFGVLIGQIAP